MSSALPWRLWVFAPSFVVVGAVTLFKGRIVVGGESDRVLFQIVGRRARALGLMLVAAGMVLPFAATLGFVLFLVAMALAWVWRHGE